jgi:hypothetical protein
MIARVEQKVRAYPRRAPDRERVVAPGYRGERARVRINEAGALAAQNTG